MSAICYIYFCTLLSNHFKPINMIPQRQLVFIIIHYFFILFIVISTVVTGERNSVKGKEFIKWFLAIVL